SSSTLHLHYSSLLTPPPPPSTYTLSLHDALPIWRRSAGQEARALLGAGGGRPRRSGRPRRRGAHARGRRRGVHPRGAAVRSGARSEEHTSELQSRGHLVCRLLLEKKKK